MSSPASTAALGAPAHDPEENRFQIYVQIAMLLAVITGIEIVTIFLPFAYGLLFSVLVVFSVAKFLLVIFYYMHLRWDRLFCTCLFGLGLVMAAGTAAALHGIFKVKDSIPLTYTPPAASAPAHNG